MELEQLLSDYLAKARNDIPALDPYIAEARANGNIQPQIDEAVRQRRELVSVGPGIVLPMLRLVRNKLAGMGPNTYGEDFNAAYSKVILMNAEDAVAAIGVVARPAVLAALVDPSPVVRSLATPLFDVAGLAETSDVASLELALDRESDPFTRIAIGGALLRLGRLAGGGARRTAAREVGRWADAVVPGWGSVARREGTDQEAALGRVVAANFALLVGWQARWLAGSGYPPTLTFFRG